MSTQYTDHATIERVTEHRPAPRPVFRSIALFDHHRLATDWLLRDESIQALRVADPTRGRFTPFRESVDENVPQHGQPTGRGGHGYDLLHVDYRRLLTVYAHWFQWRKPYSAHD